MTTYERVTYRPEGGRARTIYLQDPVVTNWLLTGIEVDEEGVEVSGRRFDERRHIISVELILKRVPMVVNKIYGLLEEA